MKRISRNIVIIILLLIGIAVILILIFSKRNVSKEPSENYEFNKNIMVKAEDEIIVDNYKVTMEYYLYDKELQRAAAIFRIDSEEGFGDISTDTDMNGDYIVGFGKYQLFLMNSHYKMADGCMYVYYLSDGIILGKGEVKSDQNLHIDLIESGTENVIHEFHLENTESPKHIKTKDIMDSVSISSVGMKVTGEDYCNISYICIFFDDGSKMTILDKDKPYDLFEWPGECGEYKVQFDKPIDIDEIKNIQINNETCFPDD